MARLRRSLALLNLLVALSLVPAPWEQLGRGLTAQLDLSVFSGLAAGRFPLPFAMPAAAAPAARPTTNNAYPPENVVKLQAGARALAQPGKVRPELDFTGSETRGPGVQIRLSAPAEPILEAELRLKQVGGRRARESGSKRIFDIPADTTATAPSGFAALLAVPDELQAALTPSAGEAGAAVSTATPTTPTPVPLSTSAAATTPTPIPTRTPTQAATAMPIATPSPTPMSGTATPAPSAPSSAGNAYGSRMEVEYEATADSLGVKETVRLFDRPRTNVLVYELELRGLTAAAQPDGSLHLLDHAERHVFTIPAPTLADARGQKGSASYRLTDKKLEVVLDPQLVAGGALPLVVDPSIVSADGLVENAPAPWQRQSVVAKDGTQLFAYYDSTAGSTGLKFIVSRDNFANQSTILGPYTLDNSLAGLGAGGFSVEIDQETDTIFVAVTGSGGTNNYFLRLYTLPYDCTADCIWTTGTAPIVIDSQTGSAYPRWSGASIAIERDTPVGNPAVPTDYVWVGVEKQTASGAFTYMGWYATLSAGALGTWTSTTPPLPSGTTHAHYGAVAAITNGVVVLGNDGQSSKRSKSAHFTRGTSGSGTWSSLINIINQSASINGTDIGKHFTLMGVPDPFSPDGETLVPLAAFPQWDGSVGAIDLYVQRYNTSTNGLSTTWTKYNTAAGNDDIYPQLVFDGLSFYLFRLQRTGSQSTNLQIRGQRGILTTDPNTAKQVQLEPDRTWVVEPLTANKNLRWLGLPRTIGTEMIPFFYIRDKATPTPDELVVQPKRLYLLGDRASWEYQTFRIPGAGVMKVNLANSNLFYQMTDADFPAKGWSDQVIRAYNSQSEFTAAMSKGWIGPFSPRLQFIDGKTDKVLASSNGKETRVNYWSADGSQYIYGYDTKARKWKPELGLKMSLEKGSFGTTSSGQTKTWKLTDLQGNAIFFNSSGRPVEKQDRDPTPQSSPPDNRTWTWAYSGNNVTTITNKAVGVTGRTQTFTFDGSGRVTRIAISNPGSPPPGYSGLMTYEYDYAYDSQERLQSVILVGNSTQFPRGDSAKRIRIEYGYDDDPLTNTQKLNTIKTPEGNVYSIGYATDGKVKWINLPDPATGLSSPGTCGADCWQFDYQEGEGKTTVSDPRGASYRWMYKVFGAGPAYELTDPYDSVITREWSTDQNKLSETRPLDDATSATTEFTYDTNRNRTRIKDPLLGETDFEYNLQNKRTKKIDARDKLTQYAWKPAGDLDRITDAENHFVDYDYDATDPRLLKDVFDARNKQTTMTYTSQGLLETSTRVEAGTKTTYTRDPWGRVLETRVGGTTPAGTDQSTKTEYDDLGRVTKVRVRMTATSVVDDDGLDLITTTSYDRDGHVVQRTDARSGVTSYTVDRRGRVTAIESPAGSNQTGHEHKPCQAFDYDEVGNQVTSRTATARQSTATTCAFSASGLTWLESGRTFDRLNRKTAETLKTSLVAGNEYGGDLTTQWEYDRGGRVKKMTDARGKYVTSEYDKLGRKTKEIAAISLTGFSGPGCNGVAGAFCSERRWEHDSVGNVTKDWVPRGTANPQAEVSRGYVYNSVQQLTEMTNELGKKWTYTYDENGNRRTETVPISATQSATTEWVYDAANRVERVINPLLQQVASFTYDKFGNRSTFTDPKGTTTYEYYKNSSLKKVTDPLNNASELTYDKNGNRLTLKDPRGKVQTFEYDALNRLTKERTPAASHTCTPTCTVEALERTMSYTLDGLLATATELNSVGVPGPSASFGYDAARRPKSIDYPTGTDDVTFKYDNNGNRIELWEAGVLKTQYTYDEQNRRLSETRDPNTQTAATVAYAYDRRDSIKVTYPTGNAVSSSFDAAGRLEFVDDWRGNPSGRTSFGYDFANRRTSRSLPSGASTTWTYDAASRLTQVEHKTAPAGTLIGRYSYGYDAAGNRSSRTDNDGAGDIVTTFGYDATHRLTSETRAGVLTTYGYDAAGNRTSVTTGTDTTSYSYDDDNRLLDIRLNGALTTTLGYDKAGSIVTKSVVGANPISHTYDAARRLISVAQTGANTVTFAYDGDGARVSKTAGTATTAYANDTRGLTQVVQARTSANPTNPVSYVAGTAQHDAATGTWLYSHSDARHNRVLTDGTAGVANRWEYDAYGVVRNPDADDGKSEFQYAGGQKDAETGLINLRARYYDPQIGRLLSRDRVDGRPGFPQSFDRFAYWLNNPM